MDIRRLSPLVKKLAAQVAGLAALRGGAGSGDWGHSGRPGQVGGSGGGGGHHTLPARHQYHKPKPAPAAYRTPDPRGYTDGGAAGAAAAAVLDDITARHPGAARAIGAPGIYEGGPGPPLVVVENKAVFEDLDGRFYGQYNRQRNEIKVAWAEGEKTDMLVPPGNFCVGFGPANTLRHEFGHAVWEGVVRDGGDRTGRKVDAFITALHTASKSGFPDDGSFANVNKHNLGERLSKYGASNTDEAFAESFARYTHPKYTGDLPKPIHDYMEKLLK